MRFRGVEISAVVRALTVLCAQHALIFANTKILCVHVHAQIFAGQKLKKAHDICWPMMKEKFEESQSYAAEKAEILCWPHHTFIQNMMEVPIAHLLNENAL